MENMTLGSKIAAVMKLKELGHPTQVGIEKSCGLLRWFDRIGID